MDRDTEWDKQFKPGETIIPPMLPEWVSDYDDFNWFDPSSYTYYPEEKETRERFVEEAKAGIKGEWHNLTEGEKVKAKKKLKQLEMLNG